jgi:hypothetical protein
LASWGASTSATAAPGSCGYCTLGCKGAQRRSHLANKQRSEVYCCASSPQCGRQWLCQAPWPVGLPPRPARPIDASPWARSWTTGPPGSSQITKPVPSPPLRGSEKWTADASGPAFENLSHRGAWPRLRRVSRSCWSARSPPWSTSAQTPKQPARRGSAVHEAYRSPVKVVARYRCPDPSHSPAFCGSNRGTDSLDVAIKPVIYDMTGARLPQKHGE